MIEFVLPERALRNNCSSLFDDIGQAFHSFSSGKQNKYRVPDELADLELFVEYVGQVQNGGHGQHFDNRRPSFTDLKVIRSILEKFPNRIYFDIFELYQKDLKEHFSNYDPETAQEDPYEFFSKIDRIFVNESSDIEPMLGAYIRNHLKVDIVPDQEFEERLSILKRQFLKERQKITAKGLVNFIDMTIDFNRRFEANQKRNR